MIKTTRQQRKVLEKENERWPVEGREIPADDWPNDAAKNRFRVIRSRDYLIQLFAEPGCACRMSVNRTKLLGTGRWDDGLTWDELQRVKSIAGYGDAWAVEIYPHDDEVVNVANMRHLWILPNAPAFAWRKTP
jgi:hypothetical protein